MSKNEVSIEQIIQTAVISAFDVAQKGIDIKLQQAVSLGVEIGAAIGADIGAKSAMQAVEREKRKFRKETYDFYYHNTEWLLKNYNKIKTHIEKSVSDVKQLEEYDADFYDIIEMMRGKNYNCDSKAESVINSVAQSKILMTQVDRMLLVYKKNCKSSNKTDEKRRFRVIKSFYIDEPKMTAAELAERESVDIRTIFRDIRAAFEDLTILMFGANGIRK